MAIKVNIEKFGTAYPSKVVARNGGAHIYNIQHTDDLWNGAVIAKGDYVSLDLYKSTDATKMNAEIVDNAANGNFYVEILEDIPASKALLVYNAPVIEEEHSKTFQNESNFYIPAEEEARGYSLREGDIIELSKENFTGSPAVGSTITTITDKKWVVA